MNVTFAKAVHLEGRRVLVVEDEYFIAMDLLAHLQQAGATVVGPVPNLEDAMWLVESGAPLDAAVLDVNLGSSSVYPLADHLKSKGVPLVFATGYAPEDIPPRFADVPHCEKPVDMGTVTAVVGRAMKWH